MSSAIHKTNPTIIVLSTLGLLGVAVFFRLGNGRVVMNSRLEKASLAPAGRSRSVTPLNNGKNAAPIFNSVLHSFSDAKLSVLQLSSPAIPVASGEKGVWYSSAVNHVNCSLLLPDVVWLGTDFGLKRLDNRTKIVQHYTPLDGLPYEKITSIATCGRKLICSAERISYAHSKIGHDILSPSHADIALCRFIPEKEKWETIAEENIDYPNAAFSGRRPSEEASIEQPSFNYSLANRQFATANLGNSCLAISPRVPGKKIATLISMKDGDAKKVLCPAFATKPFQLFFALSDSENLWIGSELGLLQYDFKANSLTLLLPDLAITGGCFAREGGLWLLAKQFDPVWKDRQGYKSQHEIVSIIRHGTGNDQEHFRIAEFTLKERAFAPHISFTNIVETGNKVWTTENFSLIGGHGGFPYFPAVYSLDIKTLKVKKEAEQDMASDRGLEKIPDSVLANSLTGWGYLAPLAMAKRFPGWVCPFDQKNRIHLDFPYRNPNGKPNIWRVESKSGFDGKVQYHRDILKRNAGQGEGETFDLPRFSFNSGQPGSFSVSPEGDATDFRLEAENERAVWIFARTSANGILIRFDCKTHA